MYFFIYFSLNWGLSVFVISLMAWASLEAQMGHEFKIYDMCVVPSFNALIYRKCYKHFCCYFWQSQTEQLPVSPGGWALPKNTALMKHLSARLSVRSSVCALVLKAMSERNKVKFASSHIATPQVHLQKSPSPVSFPAWACVFKRHSLLDAPWCFLPVNKLSFGPYFAGRQRGVPIAGERCGDLLQHLSPAFLTLIISSCQGQPSLPLLVKTCLLGMK